jgi:hypothetical protein
MERTARFPSHARHTPGTSRPAPDALSTESRTFSANSVARHPMISLPTRSVLRRTDFLARHRVARLFFFFRARFALAAGVRPCGSWLTGEGSVSHDTISTPKKKKKKL